MLKLLLYCVLLHTIFAHEKHGFGTSYLKNSRLCHQWACINTKLGLPDALPPKEQYARALKSLLPPGAWQDVVDNVIEKCYGDRPRRYTNTCPGQALMHCAVDHLIQFCPEGSLRKDDACAPLTTLAGFKYMFSQSRYENLEKNLPSERRPSWFLKNYFSSKCCNLPVMFPSDVLEQCGFTSFISYHLHEPRPDNIVSFTTFQKQVVTTEKSNTDKVKVVDISEVQPSNVTPKSATDEMVKVVDLSTKNIDPLQCCDLSAFIDPSWRSECGFQVTWDERNRLTILNRSEEVATTVPPTTVKPGKWNDVKVVPHSCEQETCVFRKLNIVSESGSVDMDAFSKLLDNVTADHTSWIKAKARVVTKCLSKPIRDYVDDCEINKVLACTFDVLSESCPHAKKHDPCKHNTALKEDITCQISSSKYRPKHRRQFCGLPNLVNYEVMSECGLNSLSRMEYMPDPVTSKPKTHWWTKSKFACKGSTDSTKCLLNKMGVLNKYGFMDYFKMKDRIRSFTSQEFAWASLTDVYLNAFTGIPMYGDQCSTPKKLLNVVDAMLMTCPVSKRKHTLQCNRLLTDIADTAPAQKQLASEKLGQFWRHFHHVYLAPMPIQNITGYSSTKLPVIPENPVTHKNRAYDFGLLNSDTAPKVEIIDVKPTSTKKPLVILPVYLRMKVKAPGNLSVRPWDGIMRGGAIYPMVPNIP